MTLFPHIIVPIDFEASANDALEVAMELAQAFGAKLTLIHVWEMPVYPYMEFMLDSQVIATVQDRAVAMLASKLEQVRKSLPNAESKLETGLAWNGILKAVDELRPDLIVMGTHGRRGLSHALLGSVAEKVVRLSPIPVLTVRPKNLS
jgi:nucleotide-binding universal stress UspA family protein